MDSSLQLLIDTVRHAVVHEQPLCIRGGGTKDFLGGPMLGDVLDTRVLRGISSYEPTELVVTARAGTPLAELEAALAEKGQCLPFEPPRLGREASGFAGGTVGGMVAAGLAGPARAAVGGVRDYVLGASLLNGQGQVLRFGGQVMKNVAGYDVSRLLAGSMGTLGLICEVSLKVLPQPPASATLRFEMNQERALRCLNEWGGQALPLNASAWWDDVLVIRLSGAQAAVASAVQRLGGEHIDESVAPLFWTSLRDQRDEFFSAAQVAVAGGATLWRLSVAPSAPPLALTGEQLIEWGGGQRWVVTTAQASVLQEAALSARGHARVFRSPRKGEAVDLNLSPALLRIHRAVKRAFDPFGLFNRQRLHPQF